MKRSPAVRSVLFLGILCVFNACKEEAPQPSPDTAETEVRVPPAPPKGPPTLLEAQQSGTASVSVTGVDLEKMHVRITSSQAGTIVIPVGQIFASGDSATQTMMSARTVSVVFPGSSENPQVQEIDLEVYCINRMLDAPVATSSFNLAGGGGELDPVQRLAACLDSNNADHGTRQLAIWVTSEHYLEMTEADVRKKLYDHALELEKSDVAMQKAAPGLSIEQIHELQQTPEFMEELTRSANQEVDEEMDGYKTLARPLLEQCNVDAKQSKFFQSVDAGNSNVS